MSSLWGLQLKTIFHYIRKEPSPTNSEHTPDFAQDPNRSFDDGKHRRLPEFDSVKRASLSALLKKPVRAGMTVEAAVVLPLFLFFLLNLSCAVEMIRLHGNLQLALWETGSRLAVYGYALEESDAASMLSWFYIREQLVEYAGKEYLDNSPLKEGSRSLTMWESDIFSSKDELDVIVTYTVSPWNALAGFPSFRMANRFCAHIWNGYEIPDDPEQGQKELDIVYIAENGEVYHEDKNCTHLKLSVREVPRIEAETSRNQWGAGYVPCEKCKPGEADLTLYITDEGNCYHSDRNCSGLKRTVFSVPRSRVSDYRACSRCG